MRRTKETLLVVIAMSMFFAVTAQERHRTPTSCSRDPVQRDGVWNRPTGLFSFHIDYGNGRGGKNRNINNRKRNIREGTTVSVSDLVSASALMSLASVEPQSGTDHLQRGEATVVISTMAGAFDSAGSVGGPVSTTVAMTVGSPDESTLLYFDHRADALSRMRQLTSSHDCLASVSGVCPRVGDLNHPRSSLNATFNNAIG